MSRTTGICICLLAMAALVAPLPVFHVCHLDEPHIGSLEFRGAEACTCGVCDHDQPEDEHAPAQIDQDDGDKLEIWLTHSPELPKTKISHAVGYSHIPTQVCSGVSIVQHTDIRGPPRSRLNLFCTLRI